MHCVDADFLLTIPPRTRYWVIAGEGGPLDIAILYHPEPPHFHHGLLDHLYRILQATPGRLSALLGNLAWEDVIFIRMPPGSEYFRGARSPGPTFGLFGRDQVIVYMEETTLASELLLKLPRSMTGEFLDVETGAALQQLSVPAKLAGPPTRVAVPSGREALVLALRAR